MKATFIQFALLALTLSPFSSFAQSYAPPANQAGTTAIHKDSSAFKAWATGITISRGYIQISDTTKFHEGSNRATFGLEEYALGKPTNANTDAISLGDGGWAILTFDAPISNKESWDFAVFENSISDDFLELAFVEVSSDGQHFFRFPAHTEVQSLTQIDGFGSIDCRYIHNFAGKYRLHYGTPLDLDEIPDTSLLDKNNIQFVKIIDVVGTINPSFASYDAVGNIVNDPFPTPFFSSGFDLKGVGIINSSVEDLATTAVSNTDNWLVYPTIIDDLVYIHIPNTGHYILQTLDGKLITQGTLSNGQNELIFNQLSKGMYLITLTDGANQKTVRLIR